MPTTRPPLNATQATNHLRRIAQDPNRAASRKTAQEIIWRMQEQASLLTVEGVLLSACRTSSESASVKEALEELASAVDGFKQQTKQAKEMLSLARQAEENRLAPFAEAAAARVIEIDKDLTQAERDFRAFELRQEANQARWTDLIARGVSSSDVAKITGHDGPVVRSEEDLVAERNRWAAEYDATVTALQAERAQILEFKVSRNECALPQSVLALVSEVAA